MFSGGRIKRLSVPLSSWDYPEAETWYLHCSPWYIHGRTTHLRFDRLDREWLGALPGMQVFLGIWFQIGFASLSKKRIDNA